MRSGNDCKVRYCRDDAQTDNVVGGEDVRGKSLGPPRFEVVNSHPAKMHLVKRVAAALRTGFRTLMPTCRQVTRLQSGALDRRLSWLERLGLRLHLLVCKWCRRYGRQIRFLRRAVREHPDHLSEASPHPLTPEARERLKKSIGNGLKS